MKDSVKVHVEKRSLEEGHACTHIDPYTRNAHLLLVRSKTACGRQRKKLRRRRNREKASAVFVFVVRRPFLFFF